MLPFQKRKPDKGNVPLVPPWHPNFRNFDRLPDTKAVRTSFFVNGVAIFVVVCLLLVMAYQEYSLLTLHRSIAEWQAQINRDQKASTQAVALFKKFQDEEKKINELENFMKSKLVLSDLLVELGNSLPNRLALQSVNYTDGGVSLKGVVRGAGDRASGEVSTYADSLKKNKYFMSIFERVDQSAVVREVQSGRMTFDLFLRFKGATAPAKK